VLLQRKELEQWGSMEFVSHTSRFVRLIWRAVSAGIKMPSARKKSFMQSQVNVKTDGQLDGEMDFSNCLSFRQRVIAKKAFETAKRNNLSFFNRFFDAVVGISLAGSVQPEAKTFVCRRRSRENSR
jgi:hypothetical protein